MSESPRQITSVLLRVSVDPGHGGPLSEYRIDPGRDGYAVTLRISGPPPAKGSYPSPGAAPSCVTETLERDWRQVEEFLGKLSGAFNVYGLSDLKPPHPFLHPTLYSFTFRDSAGRSHAFEYRIECSNHLDERYRRLVEEFDIFFESRRVFDKFFEGRRRGR